MILLEGSIVFEDQPPRDGRQFAAETPRLESARASPGPKKQITRDRQNRNIQV